MCVGPINFSGVGGGGGATPVQSLRAQSSVSVSHDEAVAVITSLLSPHTMTANYPVVLVVLLLHLQVQGDPDPGQSMIFIIILIIQYYRSYYNVNVTMNLLRFAYYQLA